MYILFTYRMAVDPAKPVDFPCRTKHMARNDLNDNSDTQTYVRGPSGELSDVIVGGHATGPTATDPKSRDTK